MARSALASRGRSQRKTALLVGEGLAEQAFLNHLKAIYVLRGSKHVTVKTAKGKGGANVLNHTHRQSAQAAYDQVGALLDTDTDWNDAQRALAAKQDIEVFEAQPCLEALLLRVAGHRVPHTTKQCKSAFEKKFGMEAHTPGLFERHFPRDLLEAARQREPALGRLVEFLLR